MQQRFGIVLYKHMWICNTSGQFYECLNMAGLYNLPHVFVVENNLWAIGMNHNRATSITMGDHIPYIYKKGPAFGFPGVHVDGMDVLQVMIYTYPWAHNRCGLRCERWQWKRLKEQEMEAGLHSSNARHTDLEAIPWQIQMNCEARKRKRCIWYPKTFRIPSLY